MSQILIFEDDQKLASCWTDVLEEVGYAVEICCDCQAAIEAIKNRGIKLVILNIENKDATSCEIAGYGQLDLNGLALLQQLKNSNLEFQPYIVAISGYRDQGILEALDVAKVLRADVTLEKPVDIDNLLNVVSRLISNESKAQRNGASNQLFEIKLSQRENL